MMLQTDTQIHITAVTASQPDTHVAYETKLLKTDVFCSVGSSLSALKRL